MVNVLKVTSGDPRRPLEVKKFDRPVIAPDQQPPDAMLLFALILGMVAMLMKMKWASWFSLLCVLSSLANASNETTDYKQIVSAITFALMGLVSSYVVTPKGWPGLPGLGA